MTGARSKPQKYSAPALEKGIEILEYLSQQAESKTLSQIAASIDRSKSEIFRMIIVLEEKGYLRRTSADEYSLTERLFQIGLRKPQYRRISEVATPVMTALSNKTRYCCHLSIASADSVVVIARADSPIQFGVSVEIGHHHKSLVSASGICLTAYMNDERRDQLIDQAVNNGTKVGRNEILDMLAMCRDRSYIALPSLITQGIQDVAAPILDVSAEHAVAALTIPYFELIEARLSVDDVARDLRMATAEIQRAL